MSQPRSRQEGGWDPFGELQALRAELARLIGGGSGSPDVEINQGDAGWTVTARLPGVAPEEVALELDDRELCIRARSEAEVNADQGMPGTGSRVRGFEYRVTLPAAADPDGVDAVMDHGLLTITVPRATRADRRTITVGRGMYEPGREGAVRRRSSEPASGHTGESPHSRADPAADRELHHPDVTADRLDPRTGGVAAPGGPGAAAGDPGPPGAGRDPGRPSS